MCAKVSLKQTLFFYTKLLAGVGALGYGTLYYKCYNLRKETLDEDVINLK